MHSFALIIILVPTVVQHKAAAGIGKQSGEGNQQRGRQAGVILRELQGRNSFVLNQVGTQIIVIKHRKKKKDIKKTKD